MVGSHWRLNVFDFFQIGNRRAINSTNPLPTPLLSPPLSSRCRRPWPFELNSNFNAILHIQAHYSRLPTYSEPTQSLLNCAFLICRRVQLCLPLAPPSRCPHHLLPPLLGCRRLRVAILPSCALQLNYAGSGSALLAWRWTANVAVSCDLAQTHTHTYTAAANRQSAFSRNQNIDIFRTRLKTFAAPTAGEQWTQQAAPAQFKRAGRHHAETKLQAQLQLQFGAAQLG